MNDVRDQFGARVDYPADARAVAAAALHAQPTPSAPPRRSSPRSDQQALATLQDLMASHNYVLASNVINQARVSINRISANPAGDERAAARAITASTSPTPTRWRPACRRSPCRASSAPARPALGDPQQPFVNARQPRVAGGRRPHLDCRAALAQVRRRRAPRGDEHRLHQPPERRPDLQRRASPATPPPTSCSACRRRRGRTTHAGDPGRLRLALRRLRPGRVPGHAAAHGQPRRCATSCRRRSSTRTTPSPAFHTGQQSTRLPERAGRAGLLRATPACRAASSRPTRTTSRRGCRLAWDPFGDGRTSVRSAFGVFYDALAGQGDFFQSGVLSPPFTPLVELNTPDADHAGRSAGGGGRSAQSLPAGLTVIGWGDDFKSPYAYHFNLGVQRQLGAQPRRRGGLRRLARLQPADLHGGQPRASTRPGRPRAAPA